jgi:hypothetical protein
MASSTHPLARSPLVAVAALLCVVLSACSGSSDTPRFSESAAAAVDAPMQLATFAGPAAAASADFPMAPRAVTPMRRDAVYVVTATNLMDWAEIHYPQFFPSHRTDQSFAPYVYRYYPETGNYLGVDGQVIRVMGTSFGASPITVGELTQFTCNVFPESCSPTGGNCTPSVTQAFAANIEVAQANSGTYDGSGGGDGDGGGDGGGAAAGGGLGKVLGGTITVIDLSDGSAVGAAVTDGVKGLVTVRTCTKPGPFLLTLEGRAGATYYDEGKNALLDFPAGRVLHALVDKWDEHVGVSPLTEAAYRYALNNFMANPADVAAGRTALRAQGSVTGLTAAQVRAANSAVAAEVNRQVVTAFRVPSVNTLPTPIDASSGSSAVPNSRYGLSAVMNGGLVKGASQYNPNIAAPALQLADDLARDLSDGRLDGFALDKSFVATSAVASYESLRLPFAAQIGADAVATRFSATALQSTELRVNEMAWMDTRQYTVDCVGFRDRMALMSDGSVTVLRATRSLVNGTCSSTDIFATEQKLVRFVADVKQLVTAYTSAYAVRNDGTVVAWGKNDCGSISGRLAEGEYTTPQVVPGLTDITSLSAALSEAGTRVVARDKNGFVYQLGLSGEGAASGNSNEAFCRQPSGSAATYKFLSPERVTALNNVTKIVMTQNVHMAVTADGRVLGWGISFDGLLLLPTSAGAVPIDHPVELPLTGVRDVAILPSVAVALMNDGTVKMWGSDAYYPLIGELNAPKPTALPTTQTAYSNVIAISGSQSRIQLAMLRSDGMVYDWNVTYSDHLIVQKVLAAPIEPIRAFVISDFPSFFFASGKVGFGYTSYYDTSKFK